MKKLHWIVGTGTFGLLVVSCLVGGPLGIIFYIGGLFNSVLVFVAMGLLGLPILTAMAAFPVLVLYAAFTWWRRTHHGRRRLLLWIMLTGSFAIPFVSAGTGWTPSPMGMFVQGLPRYLERRVDIGAVQMWLSTLDPNDCQNQRLGEKIALTSNFPDPPKYVPVPPALAGLSNQGILLSKDAESRPMIRIFLGGGGFIKSWGLEVGYPDMPMPPSGDYFQYCPLAAGTYFWSGN